MPPRPCPFHSASVRDKSQKDTRMFVRDGQRIDHKMLQSSPCHPLPHTMHMCMNIHAHTYMMHTHKLMHPYAQGAGEHGCSARGSQIQQGGKSSTLSAHMPTKTGLLFVFLTTGKGLGAKRNHRTEITRFKLLDKL